MTQPTQDDYGPLSPADAGKALAQINADILEGNYSAAVVTLDRDGDRTRIRVIYERAAA